METITVRTCNILNISINYCNKGLIGDILLSYNYLYVKQRTFRSRVPGSRSEPETPLSAFSRIQCNRKRRGQSVYSRIGSCTGFYCYCQRRFGRFCGRFRGVKTPGRAGARCSTNYFTTSRLCAHRAAAADALLLPKRKVAGGGSKRRNLTSVTGLSAAI